MAQMSKARREARKWLANERAYAAVPEPSPLDYQEAKARFEAASERLGAEFVYGVWHRAPVEQDALNAANGALLAAVEAAEAQMRALEPPDVRAAREACSREVAERDQRMARGW